VRLKQSSHDLCAVSSAVCTQQGLSCLTFPHWRAWYNCFCEPYANNPVSGNKSVTAKVLVFLAKTFAGTDLFPGTGLLVCGSQRQLYHALQWEKWQARQRLLSADSTQFTWWVVRSHKLLYLSKKNTDLSFKDCICWSYNNTSNILRPYSESTFARGRPDVQGTFGPLWITHSLDYIHPKDIFARMHSERI